MEINGRAIANELCTNLIKRVNRLRDTFGITPHLAVIRVGNDPAITSYIAQKEKMAKTIGADISIYQHPLEVSEQTLLDEIDFLQNETNIDGILVQLPLPNHLNSDKLIHAIMPSKDIDGFHKETHFVVPVAGAVMLIIKKMYQQDKSRDINSFAQWLVKQNIVILGKGKTGGQPIIDMFRKIGLHPTVIDSKTQNKNELVKEADIVIPAVGKREVVTPDMIKKGAFIIGVGLNRDGDGIFGDYNSDKIKDVAKYYTPSPGGVGPVNVAQLMENLIIAAEKKVSN